MIPKDWLNAITSYSFADDIAKEFELIIGNKKAFKQAYTLSTPGFTNTEQIIEIASKALMEKGLLFKVKYIDNSDSLCKVVPTAASRIKKDRTIDRKMSVSKIISLSNNTIEFSDWKVKIRDSIITAIDRMSANCSKVIHLHAWMDRVCHERTPLKQIVGKRNKIIYILTRYSPSIYTTLNILRWINKKHG